MYNLAASNMNHLAKPLVPPAAAVPAPLTVPNATVVPESLFERFAWIYIFCREKVFRDDTQRIIRRLWAHGKPPAGSEILELGCGPGFYSRKLAALFPDAAVLGVDNSKRQLEFAREKAMKCIVGNCRFERGNVLDLSQTDESFDAVIASRLFSVLPERERAVAEIFRVLRPGGKCFIAEPRFAFSASIPLLVMRLLARLSGYAGEYCEPTKATALAPDEFRALFATQPWASLETWRAGRYQYALGEKR
ncbi:MAG: class I SAM-dependent methyltransferase [Chthoniobacterales bacterium]